MVRLRRLILCLVWLFAIDGFAEDMVRGFARHSEKDNPIPRELIARLEKDYQAAVRDPKLEAEKPLVRHLLTAIAELTQTSPRALKAPTRITTPPGGGAIDLADYVTPLKGSFFVKIMLENEHHETQSFSRIFFVSQSKERKIDGTGFGSGCGRYFDVTGFFKKQMQQKGIELFTADQRYVNVLRGTFLFANYSPEALQVASLTFFDSRYNKWDCPQSEVL